MPGISEPFDAWTQSRLTELGDLWGVENLDTQISVRFSARFRSSLGRCAPASGEIRLAACLKEADPDLLREALTHEAAHAAAYQIHGRTPRPHGPEWRELMRRAGYEPRARIPAELLEKLYPIRPMNKAKWQHQCPVCQMTRVAHTAARRWRCAMCVADGLGGQLVISPLDEAGRPSDV